MDAEIMGVHFLGTNVSSIKNWRDYFIETEISDPKPQSKSNSLAGNTLQSTAKFHMNPC